MDVTLKAPLPLPGALPAESDPQTGRPVHRCDFCGAPMLDLHCKLRCRSCGYVRDCSDP